MDAHDVVESRLRGMRALLGSIDDPDARRLKSAQQTHVLKVLVVRLNSKAEKHHEFVARVVEALSGLSGIMASEHVGELLVCIAESVPQKACKWSMQHYSSVFAFFTDADWKQWEAATTLDHCRRITFRVAYRLGCRHASEPSTRWWTSVALAKVKELKLLELMQTSELVSTHVKTKSEWKSFVQRIPANDPLLPGRQLNCLHDDAAEFKAMHAEWFEELYKDNLPSPAAKTNLDDAVRVHQLYDCRPGKAAQQMHNGGCGSRGSVLGVDAGSSGALMQVARAIADGIHGLQVQQTQFLDRMSNRSFAQFLDSQEKDCRMRKSPLARLNLWKTKQRRNLWRLKTIRVVQHALSKAGACRHLKMKNTEALRSVASWACWRASAVKKLLRQRKRELLQQRKRQRKRQLL